MVGKLTNKLIKKFRVSSNNINNLIRKMKAERREMEICQNKCRCKFCEKEIIVGTKFFRYDFISPRKNERLNICYKCLKEMAKAVEGEEEIEKSLMKMTPKERKERINLIRGLER
jgi:hypothetical protein